MPAERIVLSGDRRAADITEVIASAEWVQTIDGAPTAQLNIATDDFTKVKKLTKAMSATIRGELYTLVRFAKTSQRHFTFEFEAAAAVEMKALGGAVDIGDESGTTDDEVERLKKRGWKGEKGHRRNRLFGPGGVRTVEKGKQSRRQFVETLAKQVPELRVHGEPYARKSKAELSTEEDNYWDAAQRVAQDVGRRVFVRRNVLWFASDRWLLKRPPFANVREGTNGVDLITWNIDEGQEVATLDIVARSTTLYAGDTVRVQGEGPADGGWIVQEIRGSQIRSADRPTINIRCIQPAPTLPEPVAEKVERGGVGDGELSFSLSGLEVSGKGSDRVQAFLRSAFKAKGNPYVWGGVSLTSGADCSGLIVAALNDAGMRVPRFTSHTIPQYGRSISVAQAIRTPGAILQRPGHVAISLGNGKTFEASSRSRPIGSLNASGRGFVRGVLLNVLF